MLRTFLAIVLTLFKKSKDDGKKGLEVKIREGARGLERGRKVLSEDERG